MSTIEVPIHDPNRGFRCWSLQEIYRGPNTGRYVPNVDDLVLDWNSGFYRVVGIDLTTGLSRMERWHVPTDTGGAGAENQLFGIDIAAVGESFRVYIDDSVTPHTLAVDSRMHIFGTTAHSIKLFQGTDLTDNGKVISAMFDQNGTFLGENIPLELVATPDQHNIAIKTPMVGYTLKKLQDGEIITAVVYDDLGYVISYSRLLAKNTAFIRTTEANRKYVTSIHLESPFLAPEDPRTLRFPTNMAVEDVPVTGVVTYSDGSTAKYPANGGRFRLYGLDHFVSTIVGQKVPLVLSYRLSEDEFCYQASSGVVKHLSGEYWGTTTEFEKAYSIKVYAYPRWVDDIRGYVLDYYMSSLDRGQLWSINSHVQLAPNTPSFRPMDYGLRQKLTLMVDMNKVDARYPPYRHVQTVEITLLAPGNEFTDNWTVAFSSNQNPPFGVGLAARVQFVNVNHYRLNVGNGFHSKEEWLRHLYYATEPLCNYNTEVQAPAPNMFIVQTRARSYEFAVDQWNENVQIVSDLAEGENILIRFIHRLDENDLQLGVAAVPVHHVQAL